jgi:hypothetical protein
LNVEFETVLCCFVFLLILVKTHFFVLLVCFARNPKIVIINYSCLVSVSGFNPGNRSNCKYILKTKKATRKDVIKILNI